MNKQATDLHDKLIREAQQGYITEENCCTTTRFEASLKITGKEKLLKIPLDLGFDEEEILDFLAEIKTSRDKNNYFELDVYYDDYGPTGKLHRQINLIANGVVFNPIMLEADQTIEIIRRLINADVIDPNTELDVEYVSATEPSLQNKVDSLYAKLQKRDKIASKLGEEIEKEKSLKQEYTKAQVDLLRSQHKYCWRIDAEVKYKRHPHRTQTVGRFTSKKKAESHLPKGLTSTDGCGHTYTFSIQRQRLKTLDDSRVSWLDEISRALPGVKE